MATSYDTVFNSFLRRIEDKDLPSFTEYEQREMLVGWLDMALSYIEFDGLKIKNDLTLRDNDFGEFTNDLLNCEIEGIAMYMVVAWYESKINSLQHTLMFVGTSSEKWTSQKDHLNMMIQVQEKTKLEARKHFRNYNYRNNDYLG